jgi:hypothetical protein
LAGISDEWDFAHTTLYLPGIRSENEEFVGKYGIQLSLSPKGTNTWSAVAFGEMYPRFENTICLDANLHDAWGVPALHINCTHSSNEVKMAADMQQLRDCRSQKCALRKESTRRMGH